MLPPLIINLRFRFSLLKNALEGVDDTYLFLFDHQLISGTKPKLRFTTRAVNGRAHHSPPSRTDDLVVV
ncbi:hypothetical protein CO218_15390 (plasmid) [Lactiplantibacillus plantarum]|nr:hypothetical protein CO218_15390 [Lactiplantibacillus plantarum]QBJ57273.1 hypothetical protein C3O83_15380 [Lactiplantibacillus plantarum]